MTQAEQIACFLDHDVATAIFRAFLIYLGPTERTRYRVDSDRLAVIAGFAPLDQRRIGGGTRVL